MTLNFAPCNMRGCGPSADQLGEMLHSIDIYAGCSGQIVPEGSCSIVPKNKKLQNKTLLCADKKIRHPWSFSVAGARVWNRLPADLHTIQRLQAATHNTII